MTHDETTAALRGPQIVRVFDPEELHEIAYRLDRYREALRLIARYARWIERTEPSQGQQRIIEMAEDALK